MGALRLTMGFCGFFVVHVVQVALAGWNNFRAMVSGYEIVPARSAIEADAPSAPSASDFT